MQIPTSPGDTPARRPDHPNGRWAITARIGSASPSTVDVVGDISMIRRARLRSSRLEDQRFRWKVARTRWSWWTAPRSLSLELDDGVVVGLPVVQVDLGSSARLDDLQAPVQPGRRRLEGLHRVLQTERERAVLHTHLLGRPSRWRATHDSEPRHGVDASCPEVSQCGNDRPLLKGYAMHQPEASRTTSTWKIPQRLG